jgi:CubicO group peptidase (beta-lactamase class C family)
MRLFTAFAALLCGVILTGPTAAQQGPSLAPVPPRPTLETPAATPSPGAAPLTAADVEAWLDGYMPYALQSGDIAGAVVVVVKDGQILVQKGYGYADAAKRTPVDPARTLFRPGSVSKLFTWTAVMQQVEQGKLDLDADINTYLDFKIPPGPGGKPITLRDVMTHTPGFEEAIKELIVPAGGSVPTLGAAVKRWTPGRIFAAGTTPAYSNYATAMAGYAVERASGVPFATYVEQNIFTPLGMRNASFRQPLEPRLLANMSKGYELGSGEPQPYEHIPMAPAGSLAATGTDMAAFMIAHLQNGAYGDKRILSEKTAQIMHGTGRDILPPLNRMLLGFYETNTNGRRAIAHGGDTQYFHSDLELFIDDNVGVFVSMNSSGREGVTGNIRSALFEQFADRYLPGPEPEGKVDAATAKQHAQMIAGAYWNSRRPENSLLSFLNLMGEAKVVANADGTISVSILKTFGGAPKKWREIAPFVWVDTTGDSRLAGKVVDGKVVRWGVDDYPFMVFDRSPAAKSATWLAPGLVASLVVLLLTAILWPVTAIVRRRYGQTFPLAGREALAYRLVRVGAAASALSIVAWGGAMVAMLGSLGLLSAKMDWVLWLLHILGSIGVIGGFGLAVWNAWLVWRGDRSWFGKLWSALLVLATALCLYVAVAFHLVGFGVNY